MKIFKIDIDAFTNNNLAITVGDKRDFTKEQALSKISIQKLINNVSDMNITIENIRMFSGSDMYHQYHPFHPFASLHNINTEKVTTYLISSRNKKVYVSEHEKDSCSVYGDHHPNTKSYGGYFNPSLHTIVREEEELRSFLQKLLDLFGTPIEEEKEEESFDQLIERLNYESDPDNREALFIKYTKK